MINIRDANDSDTEWAFKIKSEAEYELINKHFGWDAEFQRSLHLDEWNRTRPKVVEVDGKRVGFYSIDSEGTRTYLRRFFIAKEYRNRGFGGATVRKVQETYQQAGKALTLAVFKGNPAKHLYLKQGFQTISVTDKYEYMRWFPENT